MMTANKVGRWIGTGLIVSGVGCWVAALALWFVPA